MQDISYSNPWMAFSSTTDFLKDPIFVVRSSRQSENYQNLVAKNEDITYTRLYQEAQETDWELEANKQYTDTKKIGALNSMNLSGAVSRHDLDRMDAHAVQYYEQIRKRTGDVAAIAKNTGFSLGEVEAIKQHIFVNKHDLGNEELERFVPDFDMAVSWQRLIDGRNIREMDITLLNHELHELNLMAQGVSFSEAHLKADRLHSYTRFVRELNREEGIL